MELKLQSQMESTHQSECLVIANADANIWLNGQKILSDVKIRNECGFCMPYLEKNNMYIKLDAKSFTHNILMTYLRKY